MPSTPEGKTWQLVSAATAIGGTMVAKKIVDMVWVTAAGKEPPDDQSDVDTAWKEALLFAALTGLVAGVTRMTFTRLAARRFVKPEGLAG